MKKQFLLIISLVSMMPVYASKQESAPKFVDDHIALATQGGLCGKVTFVAKPGMKVRMLARRFSEGLFSSDAKPGDILSAGAEVQPGGLRVPYDWGGTRPSDHYRIFCEYTTERGKWMPVPCSQVIDITDVRHNIPCSRANYAPLNMSTDAKKVK